MLTNKISNLCQNLLNIIISIIPLSIILGSLAININVVLICLLGIVTYKSRIFKMEHRIFLYLIYSFFFYLILITLFKNLPNLHVAPRYETHIFKSFFFLRYLILFLVINRHITDGNFNTKLFFISCAFFVFLVAIDILVQVSFGVNMLGYPITEGRPSGLFGSENIAGGYLQKFSLFFIFFVLSYFTPKKTLYKILPFIFFMVPIILTVNRMSTVIYVTSVFLFLLIEKKLKEILITFLISLVVLFSVIKFTPVHSVYRLDTAIKVFYKTSVDIFFNAPKLFWSNTWKEDERLTPGNNGYVLHFNSGAQVWKKNKIYGGGIKSFQLNCEFIKNQTCNSHPHNYILEILTDTGIVGLVLIYSIFFLSLISYFKFYINKFNSELRFISMPFFLITFFEFFPLRSSGSFWTTNNAVVIFLMLAFLINVSKLKSFNNK